MRSNKPWTEEERMYLSDNWGSLSLDTLAKHLGRSKDAIRNKKAKMKLGSFLEQGDYVTWNYFLGTIGMPSNGSYKVTSWIKNRGFPIHKKKVDKCSFYIVYLDEFWEWAKKNREIVDFSKFEENALGEEPSWVKQKRKIDFEKNRKYKKTPWTVSEDQQLIFLLKKYKYGYQELSIRLRRTNGAIQRRICDLGLKERPIKADVHNKWTSNELDTLIALIVEGYGYELLSEKIEKSAKAIRGKVYALYGSENLDKVRALISESKAVC